MNAYPPGSGRLHSPGVISYEDQRVQVEATAESDRNHEKEKMRGSVAQAQLDRTSFSSFRTFVFS